MSSVKINPDALRAIRERTGLSVAELARQAGMERSTLSKIEHGERHGTPAQIVTLARVLDVPTTAITGKVVAA